VLIERYQRGARSVDTAVLGVTSAERTADAFGKRSPLSTDSVGPSCPPRRFSLPICGHFTLTYPVFRIWWDAT
jgi:hypothetical protein